MNIIDFDKMDLPSGDMLENIFNRQEELMDKYHSIEKANGFLMCNNIPVGIHDRFGQYRIKDFFWRFTEELGEALDAVNFDDPTHFHEELVDALHFLVEVCILCGINPRDIAGHGAGDKLEYLFASCPGIDTKDVNIINISAVFTSTMVKLAMSANCLKNKPWKQTHMLTDEPEFRSRLINTFKTFIKLCKYCGIFNASDLYSLYFKKSEVNKFRQKSLY